MNKKGTYPGALISFPDTPVVAVRERVEFDDQNRITTTFSGGAQWLMGPVVVVASFEGAGNEYIHGLYVVSSATIGWALIDRRNKGMEYHQT
jgi:hypothetical protein